MENSIDYARCAKGGASAGNVALAKAREKNRFNPFSTPLQKGDTIVFDVLDKNKNLILIEDENGGFFIICTLLRKGRRARFTFYPSTTVRYYQLVVEGQEKDEGEPQYVTNEGGPNLIGNESVEDYALTNWVGATITIQDVRSHTVYKFKKFVKKDSYTNDDFKAAKGVTYRFNIEEGAITDEADFIILPKTAEEIFAEANKPQIS